MKNRKRILIHMAHPAHYHLFKHAITLLKEKGHTVDISFNDKDVLEELINNYISIDNAYKVKSLSNLNNKLDLLMQFVGKNINFIKIVKRLKPDLIIGTAIIIAITGQVLNIRNIIVNEDDFDIIKLTANFGYRFADNIIAPDVCRTGKWKYKTIIYPGYHELAYLHPDLFQPDLDIIKKYIPTDKPFTLIRFAKLAAHHDSGIRGIDNQLAYKLISEVAKYSRVIISSERILPANIEKYRISINPLDIHHFLSYCNLYIGDSQTMAAEAAVLGTPFIRYNDFVGRISYLEELENKYQLGYGIKPGNENLLHKRVNEILSNPNNQKSYLDKRNNMLMDKINVANFLSDLIDGYPDSIEHVNELIEQA